MKAKRKDWYQVVVPESYEHLCQLAAKGKGMRKDACSCEDSHLHLSRGGKLVLGFCAGSFALWILSFVCIFLDTGHRPLFALSAVVLLVIICILMFILLRLFDRGWAKEHPDKVITDLIPTYLHTQINYMSTSLLGFGSRLELAGLKVRKVAAKGEYTEKFVRQFSSVLGPDEELPPYLARIAKEGQYHLLFNEVHDLFEKSKNLVVAFLEIKRGEVSRFQKSLRASVEQLKDYSSARELCLVHAKEVCDSINKLSIRFNRILDESGVSTLGSAEELSEDASTNVNNAQYAAHNLLLKLTEILAITKLEEKKPETPVTEGGVLTEADLKELEELDLSSLDK
ncbi:MAG: hypothetical protein G01um101413_590 [Parcubacteria group bacterium Gr01-1014_13]|nr:MAG: hypothetical protein G01um101413_590 [Parcubacteria group bacterium Gr01-1014_13]